MFICFQTWQIHFNSYIFVFKGINRSRYFSNLIFYFKYIYRVINKNQIQGTT
jgi:hypothetical protein